MLTPNQKAFADYYLELGNATEAAKKAGYSEKTAAATASRLLTNVNVSAYITERMNKQDAERVASADEVLRFYTDVMRGKVKDAFGLEAGLTERLKAADSLMKRHAAASGSDTDKYQKVRELLGGVPDALE